MKLSPFFPARAILAGLAWLALGVTLAMAQASLPRAQVGAPYSLQLSSPDAGTGTTFEATGLPIGLSINASSGAIAGTPTTAGTSTVTITLVSDGNRNAFVYQLVVDPAAGTPVINSATAATATVGQPFSYSVTATNSPTSFNVGALPAGLTFNAGTGQITGTPTVAATTAYSIPLSANNAIGTGGVVTLLLTVNPAGPVPAISSAITATATAVVPATNPPGYTVNYQIAASQSPVSFSATGLPFGLSVNATTGVISGTTTVTGIHTIALSATNHNGTGPATNLTLTVGSLSQITSAPTLSITVNQAMSPFTLTASNAPQSYTVTGLPPGVSADPATGVISGTPTTPGNFTVTVRANNAIGAGPDSTLTLTVAAAGSGGGGMVPVVTRPIFTANPASQSVAAGATVVFTAQAAGTAPISYQWQRNGANIAGATGTSLTLTGVATTDAGAYSVTATNPAGSTVSATATLTVTTVVTPPTGAAPVIVAQPAGRTSTVGDTVTLTVSATGTGPLTYQWNKDGVPIAGATSSTLILSGAGASATGTYTVTVTNAAGATISSGALVIVIPPSSQLINLSTRGMVRTGEGVLIAGFVIAGDAPKPVLIRAVGPSLSGFGVPGVLADPVLELFNQGASTVGRNDNWSSTGSDGATVIASVAARVGAFTLGAATTDAAIYTTLAPGAYTAQMSGVGTGTGVGLVEIYDASETTAAARLINVATRGDVGLDGNMLIAGFVIRGTESKRVLLRAAGPALTGFGVTTALTDPRLQLYRDGMLVNENDNWSAGLDAAQIAATASAVGAFALPDGSRDAVLLVSLPPGSYSAHVSGVGNTTGTALVEVYEVP